MMTDIHNGNCERIVLNALMTLPAKYWVDHLGELSSELFVDTRHKEIFSAAKRIFDAGNKLDVMTVLAECQKQHSAEIGENFLLNITGEKYGLTNIAYQVEELQSLRIRRDVETVCLAGLGISRDLKNTRTGAAVLNHVNSLFSKISLSTKKDAAVDSGDGLKKLLARMIERQNGNTNFIQSGLFELDNKVSIEAGQLVIIGARPSMGKTTLLQNYVLNVVMKQERPVLVMSAEMSVPDLYARMISSIARVPPSIVNCNPAPNEAEHVRITNAFAMLDHKPIYIEPMSAPTLSDVRHSAFAAKAKHGDLGAIFIDYLQLMASTSTNKNETETTKIGEISKGLKAIAKEFNCPVIALVQLSRDLEKRPNKRPIMSDIRSSGQIEQDADLIMFLYRDEVYKPDTTQRGIAEIIIGKNRNGETGTVRVASLLKYSQFANLDIPVGGVSYEY